MTREPSPHTPAGEPYDEVEDEPSADDSIELVVTEPDGSASRVICIAIEGEAQPEPTLRG